MNQWIITREMYMKSNIHVIQLVLHLLRIPREKEDLRQHPQNSIPPRKKAPEAWKKIIYFCY